MESTRKENCREKLTKVINGAEPQKLNTDGFPI